MVDPRALSPMLSAADMPGGPGSHGQETESQRADRRIGYQVAANLYMQENAVTWSRFNIMLTANALIVSAIGLVNRDLALPAFAVWLLPLIGLPLCVLWWAMMARGFTYHDHWRKSALRIERDLFKTGVKTLQEAEFLRNPAEAAAEAEARGLQRPRQAGLGLRAKHSAYAVIGLFGLLYLAALLRLLRFA